MLSENLKIMRKSRGLSQEQMAVRLHVVRQTISKWESGLSVPDAEMLMQIADLFGVSVSELLGKRLEIEPDSNALDTIAKELQKLNELLVMQQNQKHASRKKLITVLEIAVVLLLVAAIYGKWNEIFYAFGRNLYQWLHG